MACGSFLQQRELRRNPAAMTTATPAQAPPAGAPDVIAWYARYCAGAAALFGAAIPLGVLFIVKRDAWAERADLEPVALLLFGALWMLTMAFLSMLHVAARVTRQREPWAWTLHAIVQGIGLTTLVLWPFTLPLLYRWLKPETQRWFGRTPLQDRRKKKGATASDADPSSTPLPNKDEDA